MSAPPTEAEKRDQALSDYRKKLLKHKEVDTKVRSLRETVKELKKEYDKTEDDLKALQSVGQIIGEVLRQLDEERCECARAAACPSAAAPRLACTRAGERCGPCLEARRPRAASGCDLWRPERPSDDPRLRARRRWRASTSLRPVHETPRLHARSHRQGQQRAAVCGGLPQQGGQDQAHRRHARGPGHDHADHHAHAAARGW